VQYLLHPGFAAVSNAVIRLPPPLRGKCKTFTLRLGLEVNEIWKGNLPVTTRQNAFLALIVPTALAKRKNQRLSPSVCASCCGAECALSPMVSARPLINKRRVERKTQSQSSEPCCINMVPPKSRVPDGVPTSPGSTLVGPQSISFARAA